MRIDLDKVSAVGTYEMPDGHGGTNLARIDALNDTLGVVSVHDGVTTLDALRASGGAVSRLRWLAGSMLIESASRIDVGELGLSGEFGDPGAGHPERPVMRLSAASLHAGSITLSAGDLEVTGQLSIEGLQLSLMGTELTVRVDAATLDDVRIRRGSMEIHGGPLQARSLSVTPHTVDVEELTLGEATVDIEDLLDPTGGGAAATGPADAPLHAEATDTRPPAAPEPGPVGPELPFDFHFLDFLNGQIDVDLTVDITVPLIGRRHATHHFRIPVQAGAINYKELERDLSALEDSVIDIHLRNNRLALEKGIPLVPILFHKPILYWRLTGDEIALARRQLVRLRTLMTPRVPKERKEDTEQPPAVTLRRLELHNTDVELALGGPATIDRGPVGRILLGTDQDPAIGKLAIRGEVVHYPGRKTESTEVRASATNINSALHELALGDSRLDTRVLHVDGIKEIVFRFRGLRPGQFCASVHGLRCSGVRLSLPSSAE